MSDVHAAHGPTPLSVPPAPVGGLAAIKWPALSPLLLIEPPTHLTGDAL